MPCCDCELDAEEKRIRDEEELKYEKI